MKKKNLWVCLYAVSCLLLSEGDEDGGVPAQIFELTNLRTLQLSYQAIQFVPEAIDRLRHLTSLTLGHCPLLGDTGFSHTWFLLCFISCLVLAFMSH